LLCLRIRTIDNFLSQRSRLLRSEGVIIIRFVESLHIARVDLGLQAGEGFRLAVENLFHLLSLICIRSLLHASGVDHFTLAHIAVLACLVLGNERPRILSNLVLALEPRLLSGDRDRYGFVEVVVLEEAVPVRPCHQGVRQKSSTHILVHVEVGAKRPSVSLVAYRVVLVLLQATGESRLGFYKLRRKIPHFSEEVDIYGFLLFYKISMNSSVKINQLGNPGMKLTSRSNQDT